MNDIKDALTRVADASAPAPLSLEHVRGRARQLRRRRATTAIVGSAAAVAAIAGLSVAVLPSDSTNDSIPPATSPSVSVTPSQSPTTQPSKGVPEQPAVVTLNTEVEGMGSEPEIAYWFDGAINRPDGSRIPWPDSPAALQSFGDGWAVIGSDMLVSQLAPNGGVEWKASISEAYGLPVSEDHTVLAYLVGSVVWAKGIDDADPVRLGDVGRATSLQVAAVEGSRSCVSGGCRALVNVTDVDDGNGSMTNHVEAVADGSAKPAYPQLQSVRTLGHGLVAGITSISDQGSCSAVLDSASGEQQWQTCDYTVDEVSPDGRNVTAGPAYRDGAGDGNVAILDAATGALVRDFRAPDQAIVNHSVWETGTTVLSVVWNQGWSIMRLGVDGSVTKASSGKIAGDFDQAPVALAGRR